MKTLVIRFFSMTFFVSMLLSSYTQEHDDLYFNRKDRKEATTRSVSENSSFKHNINPSYSQPAKRDTTGTSFLGKQYNYDQYMKQPSQSDEEGVASELIEYYKKKSIAAYQDGEQSETNTSNPNFSIPEENYQQEPIVINNYYGNNSLNDNPWSFGFGWNNWGWNNFYAGYSLNSWYDPYWGAAWNGWYDPFWGPSWGYSPWCPPYYYGPVYGYGPVVVIPDNRPITSRSVIRSSRVTRGGNVSGRTSQRSSDLNRNEVSQGVSRDYSDEQAEYLNRARRAASRAQRVSASHTSNRSSATNTKNYTSDYSTGENRTYSNTGFNHSSSGRGYSSGTSSRSSTYGSSSRSSSRSSSYSRSSTRNTNTRSYSSGASSRSSSSRSSNPGRSSGRSGR